ncbi:NlpC/P60 family protein [Aneurinibacillus sp. Ricciae_BoGa-3]|uniref:C40 family peptidase n=1 Tax=Aneurinibacillus sp. Ricciae_BoGa-3 TaxID=3022697 RepID=UPI002340A1AC|nr:C40 family peptidase [Aneurinibacillus sp. Ricciae_BoGa-3]WCK52374.1 NlpC/P60 family protein [Aneurinibacillus sp. Ricciae_BoGa-3]
MKTKIVGLCLLSMAIASPVSAATYKVVKNDSLYIISQKFHVTIDQIKKANNLKKDTIIVGKALTIPVPARSSTQKSSRSAGHRTLAVSPAPEEPIHLIRVAANNTESSSTTTKLIASTSIHPAQPIHTTVQPIHISPENLSVPPAGTENPSSAGSVPLGDLVNNVLNVPYKYGGNTPDEGFDCSGFTKYVLSQMGVDIPRVAADQFNVGTQIDDVSSLKPGDLLFFDSMNSGGITHVGIYMGDNKMAHAASAKVRIDDLDWYFKNYTYFGAKRVL